MAQTPTSTTSSRARSSMPKGSDIENTKERAESMMNSTLEMAREYSDRARHIAADAGERTVEYVRRYPVNVAIGACVVGIAIGMLLAPRRRR